MGAANNISLPEPLLAEIRNVAQAEQRSVDEVLTDAVKRYVEERSWTKHRDRELLPAWPHGPKGNRLPVHGGGTP